MFTLGLWLLIALSAGNLLGLLTGRLPRVPEIARMIAVTPGGGRMLRTSLVVTGLALAYMVWLTFPLKALDARLGLAWSVLMLLAVLEAVYTARTLLAIVDRGDVPAHFPWHGSVGYVVFQVVLNGVTIGVCCGLLVSGAGL